MGFVVAKVIPTGSSVDSEVITTIKTEVPNSIQLKTPLDGSAVTEGEISFEWQRPANNRELVELVLETADGASVYNRKTIGTRRTKGLYRGKYRWKLLGSKNIEDQKWQYFEVQPQQQQIAKKVEEKKPVKLIARKPIEGDKIKLLTPLHGAVVLAGEVGFDWARPENRNEKIRFLLQRSSGTLVYQRETIGTRRTKGLIAGKYRWKIVAADGQDEQGWQYFTVSNKVDRAIAEKKSEVLEETLEKAQATITTSEQAKNGPL